MKNKKKDFIVNPKSENSILQSTLWKQFDGIVHAFSTRQGGLGPDVSFSLGGSLENNSDYIKKNTHLFCKRLGIDITTLFTMNQVHGKRVIIVRNSEDITDFNADAAITQRKNLALTIKTADCVPILIHDPVKHVIGAIHAGWRSASQGIVSETFTRMEKHFKSNPADCQVLIGPSIGPCCYEVGEDILDLFPPSVWNREKSGRYRLNLWKFTRIQLTQSGVRNANILNPELCTIHRNDLFFSYRAEGSRAGRMMALILML